MDDLIDKIRRLVEDGKVRISEHGYDELADDNLSAREVLAGITTAVTVELYPDYPKGPSVLLLQHDKSGNPVHVVWGVVKGYDEPAVLVTAYRPDPARWDKSCLRRKKS